MALAMKSIEGAPLPVDVIVLFVFARAASERLIRVVGYACASVRSAELALMLNDELLVAHSPIATEEVQLSEQHVYGWRCRSRRPTHFKVHSRNPRTSGHIRFARIIGKVRFSEIIATRTDITEILQAVAHRCRSALIDVLLYADLIVLKQDGLLPILTPGFSQAPGEAQTGRASGN